MKRWSIGILENPNFPGERACPQILLGVTGDSCSPSPKSVLSCYIKQDIIMYISSAGHHLVPTWLNCAHTPILFVTMYLSPQHVDYENATVCGYLKIQGLTEVCKSIDCEHCALSSVVVAVLHVNNTCSTWVSTQMMCTTLSVVGYHQSFMREGLWFSPTEISTQMMCTTLSVVGYHSEFHERRAMVVSHRNLKTNIIINLLLPRIHLRSPNLPWGRGACLQITRGEYATLESSFSPNKIKQKVSVRD